VDIGGGSNGENKYLLISHDHQSYDDTIALKTRTPSTYDPDFCSDGIASASSESADNADGAFDTSTTTFWRTSGTNTGWLKYDLDTSPTKVAMQYTVQIATTINNAPKDWTFEGSNDDSNWDVLHTVTGETGWSSSEKRTFNGFSNATAYRYYRINITANNGGSRTDIADMAMMEAATYNNLNGRLAQSIEYDADELVKQVRFYMSKSGTPDDTMTLQVETDSSNAPSGTLVNANAVATVAESSLETDLDYVEFVFPASFTLSANTKYWLVLSSGRTHDISNHVLIGIESTTPSYTDGELKSENNSVWSAETTDMIFQVMGEGDVNLIYKDNLASSYSSGATQPTDVDGTYARLKITTRGFPIMIGLTGGRFGNSSGNNRTNYIGFEIDEQGFTLGAVGDTTNAIGSEGHPCNFMIPVLLPEDEYQIDLQYYTTGNNVELEDMDQAVFYAYEVKS
jgi:hypothetical protein